MKKQHVHSWERHVGVKVFNGTGTAWVPERAVETTAIERFSMMWRCTRCDEPGFEVKL